MTKGSNCLHDRTREALADMVHHGRAAHDRVAGIDLDDLMADEDLRWILERTLELVGEAARRVPAPVATEIDVPWVDIIGLRHKVAHGYDALDHATLLRIAQEDVPSMVAAVETYLAENA